MLSPEKKKQYLLKVLNSKEFIDSKSYKNLLNFLVNSSISGTNLTEQVIASEGLGKNHDFDTSVDASVRVYIHNLRKKLASYYLTDGKNDEIKISIPKGQHYQVVFTIQKNNRIGRKYFLWNVSIILVLIILNIIFLIIYKSADESNFFIDKSDRVWTEFASGDYPLLIVIGDYFVFKDNIASSSNYIRDIRINNLKDFTELIKQNDSLDQFSSTEISFLGKFALWCTKDILPVVLNWNIKYDIKLSSELTWEDLNKYNIIFIGSFKSLSIMANLTTDLHSTYRIHPNAISFRDDNLDTTFTYSAPKDSLTGHLKDYTLVAKIPGPNKNSIIIFSSTHDIGHISTVNNFVNPDYLKQFEATVEDSTQKGLYFEAIYEVEGYERTGFYPNLLHLINISNQQNQSP